MNLTRSRNLYTRSFVFSMFLLLALIVLGLSQFNSYKKGQQEMIISEKITQELLTFLGEVVEVGKIYNRHIAAEDSLLSTDYFEVKIRIDSTLEEIASLVNQNEEKENRLVTLSTLTQIYLSEIESSNNPNGALDIDNRFQRLRESSEDRMALLVFIADWNQNENLHLDENLMLADDAITSYVLWLLPLLMISLIVSVIFYRTILVEFNTCDDAYNQIGINKEIFEQAEQISGLGHGYYNLKTKKLKFSDNQYRILGYQPHEFQPSPKNYIKMVDPQDRKTFLHKLRNLRSQGETAEVNYVIHTKEGDQRCFKLLAKLRDKKDDKFVVFVNKDLTNDIEAKKNLDLLNNNLSVQNNFLHYAESVAGIGSYSFDFYKKKLAFSDNLFRLLGYEPGSFVPSKKRFMEFVHPDDREKVEQVINMDFNEKDHSTTIFRIISKDGDIKHISTNKKYLKEPGIKILVAVFKDVTAERLINIQLAEQNQELHRSNIELASFNHIASHDLQEPLRKIQTIISRLRKMEELRLSEKGMDYFSRIQRAANNMQKLILDLLTYSRISNADMVMETISLETILQSALDEVAGEIKEKSAEVQRGQLPIVNVIPYQIQQLFVNLLTNSLKYSKPENQPVIKIRQESVLPKELLEFPDLEIDGLVKISVEDNGIGFDQAYAENIFVLFKRLHGKSEYPGTGIGLGICKKIMVNHKGIIYANGKPGIGTKITFIFPKNVI